MSKPCSPTCIPCSQPMPDPPMMTPAEMALASERYLASRALHRELNPIIPRNGGVQ